MKWISFPSCCLALGISAAALQAAEPLAARSPEALFRAALESGFSTAPDYVLVTIRNANDGSARLVCIAESSLEGALHRELDLGYDAAGHREVQRRLLASQDRVFTFSKAAALENVEPRYTPAILVEVRARMAAYSDEQLRGDESGELLSRIYARQAESDHDAYRDAAAHVLLERGILCGGSNCYGSLHVVDPERRARARALAREEMEKSHTESADACRRLAGYEDLLVHFRVADATVGNVNSQPRSLFVKLRARQPEAILDAVWWWNPLDEHGQPRFSWHDFLRAYAEAEQAAFRHPWLNEQKKTPGQPRSAELHLVGTSGLGLDDWELKNCLPPVWRHAGMKGRPSHSVLVRRGDLAWVELCFSDQDPRALVLSTATGNIFPFQRRNTTDPPPQTELDRLEASWHPRGEAGTQMARYALVESDGRVRIVEYVIEANQR